MLTDLKPPTHLKPNVGPTTQPANPATQSSPCPPFQPARSPSRPATSPSQLSGLLPPRPGLPLARHPRTGPLGHSACAARKLASPIGAPLTVSPFAVSLTPRPHLSAFFHLQPLRRYLLRQPLRHIASPASR